MESANCNFYVSKALLTASDKITEKARKMVLYNGVSEDFMRFSQEQRESVRQRYGLLPGDKVVAFVGNLSAVKNVLVLPELFAEVSGRYVGPVKFWVVGDGKLRVSLEAGMVKNNVTAAFYGNLPHEDMPSIMNCVDVLVLPSLNEGLPLVCAEAMRCGANVVGADVGGIAEVVGAENVVPHGDGFVEGLASRVVEMLSSDVSQVVPAEIDWSRTASIEQDIILGS
jgi:glycosyltransferase involved in cell wall biosynthesis